MYHSFLIHSSADGQSRFVMGLPDGSDSKESTCKCRRLSFHPWVGEFPLKQGMATHSSMLAWRIP